MKNKFILALCVSSLVLGGCAQKSDKISASYVSPMQYQHYDCEQIRMELTRVSRRANEVAGVQDAQAQKDSVAMGVGLVLFWPALFFMIGDDKKEEIARLKGEYEALEQAAITKKCDVSVQLEETKRLQQKRIDDEREEQRRARSRVN